MEYVRTTLGCILVYFLFLFFFFSAFYSFHWNEKAMRMFETVSWHRLGSEREREKADEINDSPQAQAIVNRRLTTFFFVFIYFQSCIIFFFVFHFILFTLFV